MKPIQYNSKRISGSWRMKCLLFLTLAALMSFREVKGQGCAPYSRFHGHTMCIYKEKACPGAKLTRSGELTCEEKEELLSAHNKFRQKVANGEAPGQPPAADMSELVWDDELATIAQRWADQSRFHVGQNVFTSYIHGFNGPSSHKAPMSEATDGWYNEVTLFDPRNIERFSFGTSTGHYTQLAWADTHTIGCGYSLYDQNDGWLKKIIVCNYGVAGNLIGGRMYTQGSPNCAAYPNRSPSPRYPGLCEIAGSEPPGTKCLKSEYYAMVPRNNMNYFLL